MKQLSNILALVLIIASIIFSACKKNKSCEGCREGNKPPIAIAGSDQQITLPTDSISLDGSASNDPDGKINAWLWKKIDGPASFSIAAEANSKTVVKNLLGGVYRFELNVTDDKGASAKDTVMITVNAAINRPPVANAGNDTSITLPAITANLDGSKSTDPDNNISSYQWTKIAGPSSYSITNTNTIKTEVNNLVEGVYQFELKVSDADGLFARDTIQVTLNQLASNSSVDIYVAGAESNGTRTVAKYWKNGIPVSLSDGSNNALATEIAISGSDVHVIGFEIVGNITVARYWKNGTPVFLTNGYSRTTDITVDGNDVYVSGYEFTGNGSGARFWKNGTPIAFAGNPPPGFVAISGNDIYVAGTENDGDQYSFIGESGDTVYAKNSVVKYWKNGTPVTLSDGRNNANVTDIAISGSDVYVVGLEQVGNDRVTKYWKNGVPVTLSNSGSIENGIAISGNDVYVAGSGSNGYGFVAAKYWKNGNPVILPTNYREPHATDIAIFGNDIYVVGFDYDYGRTNISVAKYWKNGVAVAFTNGAFFASAYSIVVMPR